MRRKTAKHSISAQWHSRWSFREHNMGTVPTFHQCCLILPQSNKVEIFRKKQQQMEKNVKKKIIATGQDKGGQR